MRAGVSQQELIRRARRGSRAAFGELVALNQERLYRFLLGRAASRADAEDALQETFVNAFRYLGSYNPRWQFSTWLYRIALRELGKLARHQAGAVAWQDHESKSEGPLAACIRQDHESKSEGPLAACIRQDRRRNLWLTARSTLSKESFTVLWLRYAEDMPVREVARAMGRPATWVRVVAHRAKRTLAKEMAADTDSHTEDSTADRAGLPESAR